MVDEALDNSSEQLAPAAQEPEKLLTQHQVKMIAARERDSGIAAGKRQAQEEYERKLAEMQQTSQQQSQQNNNVSRDVDMNAIYQQLQERFNKEQQEKALQQEMSEVADNYLTRMKSAKANYHDFDEITAPFDPGAFPQLTYLLAGMPNAGDIVYDLSKNPHKLVTLDALAFKSPQLAKAELLKLSQSITSNLNAHQEASGYDVSAPLNQLQTSKVPSGNNGNMSVSDLRNQPWLKA